MKDYHTAFIMLQRTQASALLKRDFIAFALLALIAVHARRTKQGNQITQLELNQAFIGFGDLKGLSRGKHRGALKRLVEDYKQIKIEPTSKGTIVTLIDSSVFDINAEEPSKPSVIIGQREPSKNHQETNNPPSINHLIAAKPPLTNNVIMEECKNATTADGEDLYQCLKDFSGTKGYKLNDLEKRDLMQYSEPRVEAALKHASHPSITFKKGLTAFLHWHCRQLIVPIPPDQAANISVGSSPEHLAYEYNDFLGDNGYLEKVEENKICIPQQYAWIMTPTGWNTISWKNSTERVSKDFEESRATIQQMRQKNEMQ